MEEKKTAGAVSPGAKLLYVMAIVLIVCGGNGAGLLAGAVIWRASRRTALAVAVMLAITLLAIGLAVCVLLACRRAAAQDAPGAEAAPGERQNSEVISGE